MRIENAYLNKYHVENRKWFFCLGNWTFFPTVGNEGKVPCFYFIVLGFFDIEIVCIVVTSRIPHLTVV